MKKLFAGILVFIGIAAFFGLQDHLDMAMNATGIIGLIGVLVAGFFKTGFIGSAAPVLGNLSIIKLDKSFYLLTKETVLIK